MAKPKSKSQLSYIKDFFLENPNINHRTTDIKKIIENKFLNETGRRFEDCDRGIRSLFQRGWLIKISKGIYKYDPNFKGDNTASHDFTALQKKQILERDRYKCVVCRFGKKEGADLQIDHILPRAQNGKSIISNGQTLCSRCNFLKKKMKMNSLGKKIFENLLKVSKKNNDKYMSKIANEFLDLYKKYNLQ